MDYSLAALKLLCVQLNSARQTPSQSAMSLGGILFQRAWLQGVLVSIASGDGDGGGSFLLDDGTGVIELSLSGDFLNLPWNLGMYVMVVGGFFVRTAEIPIIKFTEVNVVHLNVLRFTKWLTFHHFLIEKQCGT
ncbi:uncharacterized protein LOC114279813 isoform X5 [Camellia sinensis]|uniref:uncharacterized protein LOC114279813 isoform X5 n=1 Tax=Camellia sinensis TaxID=4442 RepID=UPI001035EDC8|nr:uncharacterized protein LOC114279813 isoform X5 [Camellia sinensis]XP_028077896.1 uncharacterized protein LOC114279813 isoform X5 [Camellia sinensis]